MRYSVKFFGLAALTVSGVSAFPAYLMQMAESSTIDRRSIEETIATIKERNNIPRAPGFDAAKQYVSNQGQYAFVKPNLAGGDLRGPCPGLNAMANHGYIPHNGIATIQQFIDGTNKVFGMGVDLAGFLAIYGAVFDGDLTSWSIGGPPPGGLLNSVGLLGTPQGISGSHNKYESDASPTRPDLYEYGNSYKVIISQFEDLFSRQPVASTANYNLDVLTEFRSDRFQSSIENNPYFFNGPFPGVLVQPAAYTFIYRFMGNKSAAFPEGVLTQDVLKSFFSITGNPGSFVWTEGNEKIPDNWYKRAIGDEYTIPFFLTDVLAAAAAHPKFLNIGGNTGKVNTFTGVDVADLTGGVYNLQTLTQGNNLACFVDQLLIQQAPDVLAPLTTLLGDALNLLNKALDDAFGSFNCSKLNQINKDQFNQFPGSTVPNKVTVTPVV